jgi:hypothetical protein
MKRTSLVLLVALLCGCAHSDFVCGNAVFFFLEGDVGNFSLNFRDDRLLKEDVTLSGQIQEWTPGPDWKVEPYFVVSGVLTSSEKIADIILSIEHGDAGSSAYSRVVVLEAKEFSGSSKVSSFEFGGIQPSGRLVLEFKNGDDWRRIDVDVSSLLKKMPNHSSDPTPAPGMPLAGQEPRRG